MAVFIELRAPGPREPSRYKLINVAHIRMIELLEGPPGPHALRVYLNKEKHPHVFEGSYADLRDLLNESTMIEVLRHE